MASIHLKIGSVEIENPAVLAPLAGITDLPFRRLAKEAGCGLVYSEMVSANGLIYRQARTWELVAVEDRERPVAVQIFGADPAVVAEAGRLVEQAGADILDINFGCSVKKIVKTGSGVALMQDAPRAASLLAAVRRAVRLPLTIKIRSGWDPSGAQALDIARIAVDCGVDAIAVHPRTAPQGFRGRADWSLIAKIKETVPVPVIGNGDVITAEDACRMQRQTNCDAVMIGRRAIGNPWIFSQFLAKTENRKPPSVSIDDRFRIIRNYVRAMVDHYGEVRACRMLRSRLGWFVKAMPESSRFRSEIRHLDSEGETMERIEDFHCRVLEYRQRRSIGAEIEPQAGADKSQTKKFFPGQLQ